MAATRFEEVDYKRLNDVVKMLQGENIHQEEAEFVDEIEYFRDSEEFEEHIQKQKEKDFALISRRLAAAEIANAAGELSPEDLKKLVYELSFNSPDMQKEQLKKQKIGSINSKSTMILLNMKKLQEI